MGMLSLVPFLCSCSVIYLTTSSQAASVSALRSIDLLNSLNYYEVLDYDQSLTLSEHLRVRRSSGSKEQSAGSVKWSFKAHGQKFSLVLSPDPFLFTSDASVETDRGSVGFDRHQAYHGHLEGKKRSHVTGLFLKDGRFEGKIFDENEEFFIERAEKFLNGSANKNVNFHSIIYKMSDVDMKSLQNTTDCKTDELKEYMADVASQLLIPTHDEEETVLDRYKRSRVRRAIDPSKTTCELYIQADHLYYQKWGSNVDTVIEQIAAHVEAANSIYTLVDFDGNGKGDNIRFVIKKLKVWTDPTAPDYPFAGNYGVKNFLEKFSAQGNFNSFCLAYTFTHRDFNDGTLGLAWTANLNAAGGVCSKNGVYNGQRMSLNSGIVTTLNYQRDVVFAVSQLTFAHELGHNLGSSHDDESSSACAPGGAGGNYIMYPKATDSDKPNNNKFSSCSITSIAEVIDSVARHDGDTACFVPYTGGVCGNKVVEAGEECDCGWEDECDELCCNPQKDTYISNTYTPCTLVSGKTCSPSVGGCCDSNCNIIPAADNLECRAATICRLSAVCDGASAACPESVKKGDGEYCSESMVCFQGECSHSICEANGYDMCQCTSSSDKGWNDESLCQLCCTADNGASCKLSSKFPEIVNQTAGMTGSPCNNYQGFCDVFNKCRKLDPVGTINSLKKILFSAEGQASMAEWLKSNWYIVAASVVGFVIILALVVKFCSKHEPVLPPDHMESPSKEKKTANKNRVYPTRPKATTKV